LGYAEAKGLLLEKITTYFAPARERRQQLSQDLAYVEEVLQKGTQRARMEAQKTMARVREAVGLREPAPKNRSRGDKNKASDPAGSLPSSPA
jgi:hypothetical protein